MATRVRRRPMTQPPVDTTLGRLRDGYYWTSAHRLLHTQQVTAARFGFATAEQRDQDLRAWLKVYNEGFVDPQRIGATRAGVRSGLRVPGSRR